MSRFSLLTLMLVCSIGPPLLAGAYNVYIREVYRERLEYAIGVSMLAALILAIRLRLHYARRPHASEWLRQHVRDNQTRVEDWSRRR